VSGRWHLVLWLWCVLALGPLAANARAQDFGAQADRPTIEPFLLCLTGSGERGAGEAIPKDHHQVGPVLTYEEFATLSLDVRKRAFQEASPETRATLARGHIREWMDVNRNRLGRQEVASFQWVITAITPELYRSSPESLAKWQVIEHSLTCSVSPEDAREAFDYVSKPTKHERHWEWRSRIGCWFESLLDSANKHLPSGMR
jgi:hypothetical protein